MKICVPTRDDRGLDAEAFDHVGGAPYYTVMDTDTGNVVTVSQVGHKHEHEHEERGPGSRIRSLNVDSVVCSDIGRRAMASLRSAGVSVLVSDGKTVREILAAAQGGELRTLSEEEVCAGHGARHGNRGGSGKRRRSHRHHKERPENAGS